MATPGSSKQVHQLKVVLRGVRPPIWRTSVTKDIYVHVRDDMFDRFYDATV